MLCCVALGLNRDQVNTLWTCLTQDAATCDECFSWCLNQAKSKDHHALSVDVFRHIFLDEVHVFLVSKACADVDTICFCISFYSIPSRL